MERGIVCYMDVLHVRHLFSFDLEGGVLPALLARLAALRLPRLLDRGRL